MAKPKQYGNRVEVFLDDYLASMVGELSKQTGKTPSYIVRGAVQVYFWLGRYLLERARAGDAALLDALGQDLALPGAWKN